MATVRRIYAAEKGKKKERAWVAFDWKPDDTRYLIQVGNRWTGSRRWIEIEQPILVEELTFDAGRPLSAGPSQVELITLDPYADEDPALVELRRSFDEPETSPMHTEATESFWSEEDLAIPAWWYFWPDDADPSYQAELRKWHMDALAGEERKPQMRASDRTVFLPENLPPELRGLSHAQLRVRGVTMVESEYALGYLLGMHEMHLGRPVGEDERFRFVRDYLAPLRADIEARMGGSIE